MEDDQYTNLQKYGSKAYTSNSNKRTIFLPQSQTKNQYFHRTSGNYRQQDEQQQQQQQFNENEPFHENFHYPRNRNDLEAKTKTAHGSHREQRQHHERPQSKQQHHHHHHHHHHYEHHRDYLQNDNFGDFATDTNDFRDSQVKLVKNYCSDPMFDSIGDQRKSFPSLSYQYETTRPQSSRENDGKKSPSYWKSSESGRIHSSGNTHSSYVPPNAHVPIERYVPKTEPYIDIKQLPILYPTNDYSYSLTRNKLSKSARRLSPKFSEKETQCNLMNNSIIVSYSLDNRLFPKSKIYQNSFCSKHYTNHREPEQVAELPLNEIVNTKNDQLKNFNNPVLNVSIKRTQSEPKASVQISQQNYHKALSTSQSDVLPSNQKQRSTYNSKIGNLKTYLKKETNSFFGIDCETENEQKLYWQEKRKRFVLRKYGPLRHEFKLSSNENIELDPIDSVDCMDTDAIAAVATERGASDMRPDVLPLTNPTDFDRFADCRRTRKVSVPRLIFAGLNFLLSAFSSDFKHNSTSDSLQASRSYHPQLVATIKSTNEPSIADSSGNYCDSYQQPDQIDYCNSQTTSGAAVIERVYKHNKKWSWQRFPKKTLMDQRKLQIGGNRILASIVDRVSDNSNRRQYGKGWVSKIFKRSFKRSVIDEEHVRKQLNDLEDHRPFFTYWITVVQILILLLSLFSYGFGPFGINMSRKSGHVLVNSLSLQQVDFQEPSNFWFGPRAADLIHLGAKFSSCMRQDSKITQEIMISRTKERDTACCIRNDDSGCVQSYKSDCSYILSNWKKWPSNETQKRISGSVCGLDPKYCDAPASVSPYEWPDDITKWPICRKNSFSQSMKSYPIRDKTAEHMMCEVIGRPCCIGIHGQCQITTKEYCDFVNGYFHEEASLCSQVSCLNDVCGMIDFFNSEVPDQFYRLVSSLFLHAGVTHIIITVLVQYYLMRDLEKLTGSARLAAIYFGSGIAGNLASAVFLPYRADVGPSGSQFGLLACLIVEVIHAWPMLKYPKSALVKLLTITGVLLILGTLPWIDNYAHIFGFLFGLLLSYAFMPFITFGKYDRHKKISLITICLLIACLLFFVLLVTFYFFPIENCSFCSFLNCLPITKDFCASQNIDIIFDQTRI